MGAALLDIAYAEGKFRPFVEVWRDYPGYGKVYPYAVVTYTNYGKLPLVKGRTNSTDACNCFMVVTGGLQSEALKQEAS
jgi:hypothetical protein